MQACSEGEESTVSCILSKMEYNTSLITILATLVAGSVCIALAEKTKTPAIIYYFAAGLLLGKHAAGLIDPASLGGGLMLIISLFVSIILFEGGFTLNLPDLKQINRCLWRHMALMVLVMFPLGFLAAHYIAGLGVELSLVFGSLTVVTGPTVIKPILRHIPLRNRVSTFLNGEAVIIDAIGAVLAIVVLDYIIAKSGIQFTLLRFLLSLAVGAASGALFGLAMRFILAGTRLLPDSVKSIFIIGMVFLNFGVSERIAPESGLMSVAVFGIALSTIDYKSKERILSFKEQISRLIIAILFILISARIDLSSLSGIIGSGLLAAVLLVLARFPIVFLSTMGDKFSARERIFMGWVGPRGIIALAVASVAVFKLGEAGFSNAETVELLVFVLIALTVSTQGLSAGMMARRLGILVHGDRNMLILGVNDVSLTLADYWRKKGHDVLFVDSSKKNGLLAAEKGYRWLPGNGLSPQTYAGIEMDGFQSAFAASTNHEINVLFCRFIKDNYGIARLYSLVSVGADEELFEITRDADIKTITLRELLDKKSNITGMLIGLFIKKKFFVHELRLTGERMLRDGPGSYQLPQGYHPLCVMRGEDCYLYYSGFRLERDDELVFISLDRTPLPAGAYA